MPPPIREVQASDLATPFVFGRPVSIWYEGAIDYSYDPAHPPSVRASAGTGEPTTAEKPHHNRPYKRHFDLALQHHQTTMIVTVGNLEGAEAARAITQFAADVRAASPELGVIAELPRLTLARIAWTSHVDAAGNLRPKMVTPPANDPNVMALNTYLDALKALPNLAGIGLFDEPNIYLGQHITLDLQRNLFPGGTCPGGKWDLPPKRTGGYLPGVPFASPEFLKAVRRHVTARLAPKTVPHCLTLNAWWPIPGNTMAAWLDERPEFVIPHPAGSICGTPLPPENVRGIDPRAYRDCADVFLMSLYPLAKDAAPFPYSAIGQDQKAPDLGWVVRQIREVVARLNFKPDGTLIGPFKPVMMFVQAWGNAGEDNDPQQPPAGRVERLQQLGGELTLRELTVPEIRFLAYASYLLGGMQGCGFFARLFEPWFLQTSRHGPVMKEIFDAPQLWHLANDSKQFVKTHDPAGNETSLDRCDEPLLVRFFRLDPKRAVCVVINPSYRRMEVELLPLDGKTTTKHLYRMDVDFGDGRGLFTESETTHKGSHRFSIEPYHVRLVRIQG